MKGKSFSVIIFRVYQRIIISLFEILGLWIKIEAKLNRSSLRIISEKQTVEPLLIVFELPKFSNSQIKKIKSFANNVYNSNFSIFNSAVPNIESYDFVSDWRFKKKWKKEFYKKYQFYEIDKKIPYDVKFPWELSRFTYLVPLLSSLLITGEKFDYLEWIDRLLRRWSLENPLAHSVNWYPMEASMRIVNIIFLLDIVNLLYRKNYSNLQIEKIKDLETHLLSMLIQHGYFVWLNREFTDIRGNHFTANITALFLAAEMLYRYGNDQPKWRKYAVKYLNIEATQQFLLDGVNFEKSCGYHKLVLELFMLAAIARKRSNIPFDNKINKKLILAAQYSDALTKTTGQSSNFGDNDNATAVPFNLNTFNHGSVVELARAFYDCDIGSTVFSDDDQLAALFLVGKSRNQKGSCKSTEFLNFPQGGYVIIRNINNGFFLMIDVGEVGQAGLGGHGHNDLLAFELCISGKSIVIDPGCSGYTSDLTKKKHFKKTRSHSTVELFQEEIAEFLGPWQIRDDAHPLNVSFERNGDTIIVKAGHDGYERLCSGTRIHRTFLVNPVLQSMCIEDEITAKSENVNVSWHFPIGRLYSTTRSKNIFQIKDLQQEIVSVRSDLSLNVENAIFSEGYGHEDIGRVIFAETTVGKGVHKFKFFFNAVTPI